MKSIFKSLGLNMPHFNNRTNAAFQGKGYGMGSIIALLGLFFLVMVVMLIPVLPFQATPVEQGLLYLLCFVIMGVGIALMLD